MNMNTGSIEKLLDAFNPIQLEEVQDANLMNRRDTKFVFSTGQLTMLLKALSSEYYILDIDGVRAQHYETTYFDTADLKMYHMHHRGEMQRHKIRVRHYTESERAFLEVKVKNNRGITGKQRVECKPGESIILSDEEEFLVSRTPFNQQQLYPVLVNSFNRITLVNKEKTERVTLDYSLRIRLVGSDRMLDYPGIVIAEIKTTSGMKSELIQTFRRFRIKPMRFSKYCIGVARLNDNVVSSNFRTRIRMIDRIEKSGTEYHNLSKT